MIWFIVIIEFIAFVVQPNRLNKLNAEGRIIKFRLKFFIKL